MLILPAPHCAKCNHEVESLTSQHSPCMTSIIVEARCHGEVEYTTLTFHELQSIVSISQGVAFSS